MHIQEDGKTVAISLIHTLFRYLMLPWGNALLQRKHRLEVSKYVSFAAEVLAVCKVTIVPQLFS